MYFNFPNPGVYFILDCKPTNLGILPGDDDALLFGGLIYPLLSIEDLLLLHVVVLFFFNFVVDA